MAGIDRRFQAVRGQPVPPLGVPEEAYEVSAARTAACTNAVVASAVELSEIARVGAVGVPVRAGDAMGA